MAHQVCAGNRLVFTHQIEHDAAVDVARRFARCHLEIVQINFAHEEKRAL
jgi:hypothetical protein